MSFSTNKAQGIIKGGAAGQVLIKASNTNYDTTWGAGGGGGGAVSSVFGRINAVVATLGDYTSTQVTQGSTNLYFTNALTRAAISASSPLSFSSGIISIPKADRSTNGYLSSSDWTTFNSKGNGTVTNIAMTVPAFLAVTGTPITTGSGTFAITSASGLAANSVLATPDGTTGAVSVRSLVANDIPNISAAKITTGVLSPALGGAPLGFFGDGSDGDLTITTTPNLILSRDVFYRNVTISGLGLISTNGYRMFISGTLDLTNAPVDAIRRSNGTNGGNASGSTGGSASAFAQNQTVGGAAGSTGGAAGATGITTTNTTVQATAISSQTTSLGGSNGASGGGGITTGSANPRTQVAAQVNSFYRVDHQILRGASLFGGGLSGAGGTSGGGDGTNAGAGGGGGGSGGGIVVIFANTIARGSSTAAGCIRSNATNGGNGAASTLGTTGGGGGGSGGGGGVVIIYYASLAGTTVTNAIQVYGGNGGNGGNSVTATRSAGQGGQGGSGGRVILFDVTNGTITETNGTQTSASAPATIAAGNQTGGTGTTGTQTAANL
jgi:hypothetical protein